MKSRSSAFRVTVILAISSVILSGCVTTAQRSINKLERGSQDLSILLMPMDIELSELTAGGVKEPKADWTAQAEKNVTQAVRTILKSHNAKLKSFVPAEQDSDEHKTEVQLVKLHSAVGQTILFNKLLLPLPTKTTAFDWSLGKDVSHLKSKTKAKYGLFVYVRDSYTSAGRAAVMVIGAILGVGVQGGQLVGYASLVDLTTGDIVWFNHMVQGTGDLRNDGNALESVKILFAELPK